MAKINRQLSLRYKDALSLLHDYARDIASNDILFVPDLDSIEPGANGVTFDSPDGKPIAMISLKSLTKSTKKPSLFAPNPIVDDNDFVTILTAINHENHHLENFYQKYKDCADDRETANAIAVSYVAKQNNTHYYQSNYLNSPFEIDAEIHAISHTYDWLKSTFPSADADKLVATYVNNNIKSAIETNSNYILDEKYYPVSSMEDIEQAFSDKMEHAIHAKRRYHQQAVKTDETMKLLKQRDWCNIFDTVCNEQDGYTKDKMIASIVVYKHPNYTEYVPPDVDLSPTSLFGHEFPDSLATQRAAQAALELNSSDFEDDDINYK
jgi:hypothetical protein